MTHPIFEFMTCPRKTSILRFTWKFLLRMLVPILKTEMSACVKDANSCNSARVTFDLPIERESIVEYVQGDDELSYPARLNSVLKILCCNDSEDALLLKWLAELKDNILFLNKKNESIIFALLKMEWYNKDDNFVRLYQELILNLVTAHPIYLKHVLYFIISIFVKVGADKEVVTADERKKWQHAHDLSKCITELIPFSQYTFYVALVEKFPYIRSSSSVLLHYIENLLTVCSYLSNKRHLILECIIEKLIQIDALCSKDTIEKYEMQKEENLVMVEDMEEVSNSEEKLNKMAFPLAHTLDVIMNCLFTYVKKECFFNDGENLNWESTKKLYKEILTIFDKIILPTQGSCHVQYVLFYICGFKQELCVGFLDFLWKKVQNPNVAPVLRQISAFYIGSLLSRAKYINISTVTGCFDLMCNWIHRYIEAHTSRDLEVHGTFHSVCQTVFYVFAFRSKELLEMKEGHKYLQGLNFDRIVTCRLNPLRFCDRNVVQNFASIARNNQIAYVYPVIERNNRNLLYACFRSNTEEYSAGAMITTFFPFDPYLLKRSKHWIDSWYRIYHHTCKDDEIMDSDEEEEMKVEEEMFSYGSSPGFKKSYLKAIR
ncbi:RNA polymerase I-specific transcription initiation factor RRN3 [Nephila pilipes]|uniref:RNA polymerase I-specific transcription initiation factor RRN3 n=1 Tax=Nephila pilipes TaxID=299642 RepID=A0A8X6R6M8_NEPPI|nr:RNA polymerase I-specific transcription initiation factor RRN3 [Nephila pilipes]